MYNNFHNIYNNGDNFSKQLFKKDRIKIIFYK